MTGDRVKRLGTCGEGGEARAGLQCSHGGSGSSSRRKGSVDLSCEGDARLSEVSPDGVLRGWLRGPSRWVIPQRSPGRDGEEIVFYLCFLFTLLKGNLFNRFWLRIQKV